VPRARSPSWRCSRRTRRRHCGGKLGVIKRAAWSEPIALAAVKSAAARSQATINDLLVAAAAGALRRYLIGRGDDVVGLEIRAAVPVNLRPPDQAHRLGNRFGLIRLALPLGIADSKARVSEVKRRMDDAKSSMQPALAYGLLGAFGLVPAQLQAPAVDFFGSKVSLVLTNVPGPREQLYVAGKPLRRAMFWVPQSGHVGLGVSILSYASEVMVGVAADAGLVPDPQSIVRDFEEELQGLLEPAPKRRSRTRL